MFIGEYAHSIDKKGRMIVPAKFREQLGATIIVTKGLDHCLAIYTLSEWDKMYQKLITLPSNKKEVRMFVRMLTSKAAECEIDAQGRILIPAPLIKEAGLEKDCIITGNLSKVEVWSKECWDEYNEQSSEEFEKAAESIEDYGNY
ncbi:MAG: division/cell wall cluster transcriptional repressor MraZ [Erysipelotrichaceae bacterium]